jgi:hypothetical protein
LPTSATHITIVQRIATDPKYRPLLGDPDPMLPATDPEAIKMRFASLGACGPDFLYALMDYGSDVQDLENILIKTAGTFSALADVLGEMQKWVDGTLSNLTQQVYDSFKETSQLLNAVMTEGLFALLASGGVNPFAIFEARRQTDMPVTTWFWADVLHYWRSGTFVENLVKEARQKGNPNVLAYAYGYVTHYVTDVVGHPYVNQVVGAPWRLYWQRHHLVENFIDAYVWDRWHRSNGGPPRPGAGEPPLDSLVTTANAMGTGAPLTYSRLNDHVNIGSASLGDPVDALVDAVAMQLKTLLTDIGIAVDTEPDPPTDPDFDDWTDTFVKALRDTYDGYKPTNLTKPYFLQGNLTSRSDGFPTKDDIAAAYGAFRLLLRITTEETIVDPQPPSITQDISAAINQLASDVAAALSGLPAPPALPNGGAFSVSAILDALEKAFEWASEVAEAVVEAASKIISDAIALGTTVAADVIKFGLWVIAKALYALYRSFRDVLMLRAYASPYGDQLAINFGALATTSLWQSMGNPAAAVYPHEEILGERTKFPSTYMPADVPSTAPEQPAFGFIAPYGPTVSPGGGIVSALPDAFIDPAKKSNMFDASHGPQAQIMVGAFSSFATVAKNFGGAIANSKRGIDIARAKTLTQKARFPNYNLDGDRSYAWPCWDVDATAPAPLDPAKNSPSMIATVHAAPMP